MHDRITGKHFLIDGEPVRTKASEVTRVGWLRLPAMRAAGAGATRATRRSRSSDGHAYGYPG